MSDDHIPLVPHNIQAKATDDDLTLSMEIELDRLRKRLEASYPEKQTSLQPGDRLLHYKNNVYVVLTVGRATEHGLEDTVVYRREDGTGPVWIRPAAMFEDIVTVDGQDVPRYKLLDKE